ncbi:MAG: hypothetical protein AAFU33_06545 [Bacteroidota bacterium]
MPEKLKAFNIFDDAEEVKALALWLQDNGILYELERHAPGMGAEFFGTAGAKEEFILRIPDSAVEVMYEKFEEEAAHEFHHLPEDFYLLEYSDEELFELIQNPKDWHPRLYYYAVFLLRERDYEITDEQLREHRIPSVAAPKQRQKTGLLPLLMIYLTLMSVVLAPVGFGLCIYMMNAKQSDGTGNPSFRFHASSRKTAKWVLIASLVLYTFAGLFYLSLIV